MTWPKAEEKSDGSVKIRHHYELKRLLVVSTVGIVSRIRSALPQKVKVKFDVFQFHFQFGPLLW